MGTERSVEYEGHCLCGKGTFRIDNCEVDHAWPTANPQWYETQINCPVCSDKFSLERLGGRFVLIEKKELREREQRKKAANLRANAILSDPEVLAVISRVEAFLNSQPSVAAIYRLLQSVGLADSTEGTFRRHWSTSGAWLKLHARPGTLMNLFTLVGAPTVRLNEMLDELNNLEAHASRPPAVFGEPVYILVR